jgi:hypothetical protein
MFEILITVFAPLAFNYSLQFEVCGVTCDASYIYLDSNEILLGVRGNSSVIDYSLIKKLCNTSLATQSFKATNHSVSSDRNITTTGSPLYTATMLPHNDQVTPDGRCNLYHYLTILVALATFIFGLVIKPDVIYDFLMERLRCQLYTGNYFSRIRTRL